MQGPAQNDRSPQNALSARRHVAQPSAIALWRALPAQHLPNGGPTIRAGAPQGLKKFAPEQPQRARALPGAGRAAACRKQRPAPARA